MGRRVVSGFLSGSVRRRLRSRSDAEVGGELYDVELRRTRLEKGWRKFHKMTEAMPWYARQWPELRALNTRFRLGFEELDVERDAILAEIFRRRKPAVRFQQWRAQVTDVHGDVDFAALHRGDDRD